jgi:hypothetical protein
VNPDQTVSQGLFVSPVLRELISLELQSSNVEVCEYLDKSSDNIVELDEYQ